MILLIFDLNFYFVYFKYTLQQIIAFEKLQEKNTYNELKFFKGADHESGVFCINLCFNKYFTHFRIKYNIRVFILFYRVGKGL